MFSAWGKAWALSWRNAWGKLKGVNTGTALVSDGYFGTLQITENQVYKILVSHAPASFCAITDIKIASCLIADGISNE